MAVSFFFTALLLSLATLHGIHAVEYVVNNQAASSPGGIRFNNELGIDYTKQIMAEASNFIWQQFQQNTPADRKNVPVVTLFVEEREGVAVTFLNRNEIHVSQNYIGNIKEGNTKRDFNGVLYHEMVHIWQNYPPGTPTNPPNTPTNVTEGIADFVRLRANYAPDHWKKPGEGTNWNLSYDTTARFLDYCEGLRSGFVAELNKKMKDSWSDDFFAQLLGKPVDELFRDYKAQYGNLP